MHTKRHAHAGIQTPTHTRTPTPTPMLTHPGLVHCRACPNQSPHHLIVTIPTGDVQWGATISLPSDTRTHSTMMAHTPRSQPITHMNASCSTSTATARLEALHEHRSHRRYAPSKDHKCTQSCKRMHAATSSAQITHANPNRQPQSSRTLAWFTAAPEPTSNLTTSTWPLRPATYSGVAPSACQTTRTDKKS
jgi:hypothetical protein